MNGASLCQAMSAHAVLAHPPAFSLLLWCVKSSRARSATGVASAADNFARVEAESNGESTARAADQTPALSRTEPTGQHKTCMKSSKQSCARYYNLTACDAMAVVMTCAGTHKPAGVLSSCCGTRAACHPKDRLTHPHQHSRLQSVLPAIVR